MPKTVEIQTAILFLPFSSSDWSLKCFQLLVVLAFYRKILLIGTVVAVLNYCRRGWGVMDRPRFYGNASVASIVKNAYMAQREIRTGRRGIPGKPNLSMRR